MTQLERQDIQGIVLSGYNHLLDNCYLFLSIGEAAQAKAWLAQLQPQVTDASPWEVQIVKGVKVKQRPPRAINLAFSASGLQKLGVKLDGFLTEFREGIAGSPPQNPTALKEGTAPTAKPTETLANRSKRLGDTGKSDPATWEIGGPNDKSPVDIMLMLFADSPDSIKALRAEMEEAIKQHGLQIVAAQDGHRKDREPFGFMDGFSQPHVEGDEFDKHEDNQPIIKAGEFLLGYRNEYNLFPPVPDQAELGKNSTYMVYRKLEQDVAAFWNYVYDAANNDDVKAEYLAAKMVGRWRSGTPFALSPLHDDPDLASDLDKANNFKFAQLDKTGFGCPVSSHIRRSNPRDSLMPDPAASIATVNKHRVIRRGRFFGPPSYDDVVAKLKAVRDSKGLASFVNDNEEPRGLALIAINADIKRQFEFIQQTWINDPKFDGLYDDRDPLVGNNGLDPDLTYNATIERHSLRRQLQKVPRFVDVRAGLYMFLPSMSGLKFIAK
jgi:Dyp-type peroxidase family